MGVIALVRMPGAGGSKSSEKVFRHYFPEKAAQPQKKSVACSRHNIKAPVCQSSPTCSRSGQQGLHLTPGLSSIARVTGVRPQQVRHVPIFKRPCTRDTGLVVVGGGSNKQQSLSASIHAREAQVQPSPSSAPRGVPESGLKSKRTLEVLLSSNRRPHR